MASTPSTSVAKTLIRPPTRWPTLGLGELIRYRAICMVLVRRSIMVRYRQTVVGASWAILQPLLLMLVFTIFFGILSKVPSEGLPYSVFVLIGLTIWQVVGKVLNEGSLSVVNNGPLVTRIYFPRSYFPFASAIGSLVDLVFGLVVLAVLLLLFAIPLQLTVLLVPFFVAVALAAVTGVSLWLSALYVDYRDIAQLLPFITQLWLFSSPIIYSSSIIPAEFQPLYWLNPMALAVDGLRWSIAGTFLPPTLEWVEGLAVAALLLCGGYVFFRKREPGFADAV